MKKSFFLFVLGIVIAAVFTGCSINGGATQIPDDSPVFDKKITLFKSQSCGCCSNYESYLKKKGFTVQTMNVPDLSSTKAKYGVPASMESCHTVVIDNYFIEGHMPVEAIAKLVTDQPSIKGIALPGMPPASPGMPGAKSAPFEIFAVDETGKTSPFMTI